MALAPGTRVGVYEIVGLIGAGGMGEVYRAHDPKLNRDVALKVLPALLAADSERLARFKREAQVLASLDHPNIAHIHGFEDGGGVHAIVLELVEGPTLADRIVDGPIPLDDALPIAGQIAEALEAAHEHGIIHRDLKPANIKLRPDGTVKVLDFGLAKALDPVSGSGFSRSDTMSPTITAAAGTGMGVILGTAAYMSPEQAKGKQVDKRADLWAFGCVLYEILTGRRAFDGDSVSETLAEIIKGEPKWEVLPTDTPPAVRRLLRRCLAKDPRTRIPDAAMVRIEIDEALAPIPREERVAPPARRSWRGRLPYAAVACGTALAVGVATWWLARSAAPAAIQPMRFAMIVPQGVLLAVNARQRVAISNDGRRIVYAGAEGNVNRLYVRALDRLESVPIAGVENVGSIFLSPDGEWVGYNDTFSGAFRKVPIGGGPSATICEAPAATGGFRGATWGSAGQIVFGTGAAPGLMKVSDAGGTPEPLTSPPDGEIHRDPHFLPDGRTLLFVIEQPGQPEQVGVISLESRQPRVLLSGLTPKFASSGHIIFFREGALWAARFDVDRLNVVGNPVPVLESVDAGFQVARYDLAGTGTLVYSPVGGNQAARRLTWVDRAGREGPIPAPPRGYFGLRLSPDGTRVALDIRDQENDIWIWDFRGETLTRVSFDPSFDDAPVWTPDGRRIAWRSASARTGLGNIFWRAADGTGSDERLTNSMNNQAPTAFSPDGLRLLVNENAAGKTLWDIMRVDLDGTRAVHPLVQTQFFELNAEISPDGRWMAYQSRESTIEQVFVRPFPDVQTGRWQVSTAGGRFPVWARSGRELFYLVPDGTLVSATVKAGNEFATAAPVPILKQAFYTGPGTNAPRSYDVSADGRRFLMIKDAPVPAGIPQVIVVSNWFEELKRRLPTN